MAKSQKSLDEDEDMIGHNSMNLTVEQKKMLKGLIASIEEGNKEKAALSEDISAYYADAKAKGFDTKQIRKLIKERKEKREKTAAVRQAEEDILDLYRLAVGDI
jgi:uncharacterized protein (UPF0335 family)